MKKLLEPKEDQDRALVETPYGRGCVVRTRRDKDNNVTMREIVLQDWSSEPELSSGTTRPSMLYSADDFPPIKPEIGNSVVTTFGRGRIVDVRKDSMLEVRITSWRLAGRSTVTCYLVPSAVRIVQHRKQHEMTTYEKVDLGQELKQKASVKFAEKNYMDALLLYSKAVDAGKFQLICTEDI